MPTLAEVGWDVWERLAALEPADPSRGATGAGQLEAGLSEMSAVLEQRNRLQVTLPPGYTESSRPQSRKGNGLIVYSRSSEHGTLCSSQLQHQHRG